MVIARNVRFNLFKNKTPINTSKEQYNIGEGVSLSTRIFSNSAINTQKALLSANIFSAHLSLLT